MQIAITERQEAGEYTSEQIVEIDASDTRLSTDELVAVCEGLLGAIGRSQAVPTRFLAGAGDER
jgi:hypothetical protein